MRRRCASLRTSTSSAVKGRELVVEGHRGLYTDGRVFLHCMGEQASMHGSRSAAIA